MRVERLYAEVVRELERRADVKGIEKEMRFHRTVGAGFKCYGIGAPEFKKIAAKFRRAFKELSFEERFELARKFFSSGYGGQMSFGTVLLKLNTKEMTPADFGILDEVGGYLNNWGTVDGFCIDVLQPLLLKYPKEVLELLKKWNKSESLWKRRASVVTFTRKIGASGRFTSEALELCDRLVWDEEDLVRKGVGWALKDCMRGDKERVKRYVKDLRRKGVSAVITLYAIRDLKGKEREEILKTKI
ncbi:MAG: DNA alkylation repair protein [Candidatus Bathyarchaeia archaeon]